MGTSEECTNGVTATLITSAAEWDALAAPWEQLFAVAGVSSPFISPHWLRAWWECFHTTDRSLFVIALYQDEQLIAVAPWFQRRIAVGGILPARCIESLGYPEAHSDYLDVLCAPGQERNVALALYDFLFNAQRSLWDRLCLRSFPAESAVFLFFLDELERRGKFFVTSPGPFCPVAAVPTSKEKVLENLSPRRRKRLMQEWRTLSREQIIEHETCRAQECRGAISRFLALYLRRWPEARGHFENFLLKLCNPGGDSVWIEIDFLRLGGRDVAAIFQVRSGAVCFGYLQAVDHEAYPKVSLGGALLRLVMERISDEGCTHYDFLAGSEDFKFIWTNHGRRSLSLTLYQPRFASFVSAGVRSAKDILKLFLR